MNESKNPFKAYVDLAQPRLGAEVVFATDDFFAAKERMIDPKSPVFIEDKFDDNGKWMDGWESRRKRVAGHDFALIKLGLRGKIKGFDIDTSHFTGNYPPEVSIEACDSDQRHPDDQDWLEICAKTPLQGDSHHYIEVSDERAFTHLRLHIYPDGGIARLRVYGQVLPDWQKLDQTKLIDLLGVENGGRALVCNDEHFGSMHNLNAPGRGINMGDGWETARRRRPGNDWVVLALGHVGDIGSIEIDTAHFKGNYPDRVSILATNAEAGALDLNPEKTQSWEVLLPEAKLEMDKQHLFTELNPDIGPITHIRMNIFPDGGVSRVRLLGHIHKPST